MNVENLDSDSPISEIENPVEKQIILSVDKFVILSVLTFNFYFLWWVYKEWKFYQQKEGSDILPAVRALFCIFFLISLFTKMLESAKEKGYQKTYSPVLLFISMILCELFSKLPEPAWLFSFLIIAFVIPPFKAINFAKLNSNDFAVFEQSSFNQRQVLLLIIGSLLWGMFIWLYIERLITEQY